MPRNHCSPTVWLCPQFVFRDYLWQPLLMDLYSWIPSFWGTPTSTAMFKQNKVARLPRWALGRQVVYLWEAISNNAIWNMNALGGWALCLQEGPIYLIFTLHLLFGMTLPWPCLNSRNTCTSGWVVFSNSWGKATVQILLKLDKTSDQNSPLISGCLQATAEQFLLTLFPSV